MASIRIFRVTAPGDDKNTEFIDFNVPGTLTEKTDIENAFITSIKKNPSDGVGNNQGAELPSGDQQALGEVENIYEIDGFISKRNGDANDGNNGGHARTNHVESPDVVFRIPVAAVGQDRSWHTIVG